MVNKIKKFFKSIGKSSSSSSSMSSASGYPLLATSDNQFHHQQQMHERGYSTNNNNLPLASSPSFGLAMDTGSGSGLMATEGSGSGSDSMMAFPQRQEAIRWGLLLPKIPRLVAEATAAASTNGGGGGGASSPHNNNATGSRSASSLSQSDDHVEMNLLLEMLTQMAPKELQTQIAQYYAGDMSAAYSGNSLASSSSNAPTAVISNWEQRKVFRQCRRSLLLCWKFIVAQLNDENAHVTSELKETYFQLIGLIAERVEFNLSGDTSASSNTSNNNSNSNGSRTTTRQQNNSGHMMGWTVNSPTAVAATPINSIDLAGSDSSNNSNGGNSIGDEGMDGERDLYLYRCLLVATFKYVVENIENANLRKRSWITLLEIQFFAKVIAICFFRIPVIQRMVIDQIYFTYRQKRWTNTATPPPNDSSKVSSSHSSNGNGRPTTPEPPSRSNRRRSSSRLSSGVTFAGSLSRWSEFEGHVLSESNDDGEDLSKEVTTTSSSSSSDVNNQNSHATNVLLPTRAAMDKFKRMNPTLYRWSRYVPYLAPYADTDVFRMNDSMRASWLEKLSHDGEFFAAFMGHYTQHAEMCATAGGGELIWNCLPGYPLLIRVSLLLLKEASWGKWMYIRDNTAGGAGPAISLESPSNRQDEREPFELKAIRGIRTVLETAVQWLRNKELLESCMLATYECTNVLHARSVSFCLTKFEEWFSATAALMPTEVEHQHVYKLPPSFTGQTFAIGIRLMLSSESFEILNRVLTFLYNRMEYFDGDLRQNILKVLVQRHMSLFLHWNVDVRSNYHHLLVYKVIRVNRYFLDSPIDHLLVGRHAISQLENSISVANGFDEFDDHLAGGVGAPYASQYHSSNSNGGNNGNSSRQYQISAAEFSALRTEQALWRAFDACIGAICVQERRNAKEGNRKYQYEIQCARSRAIAFQKLNRKMVDNELNPTSSVNEGLPGGKPWLELDLLDEELHREPPYYLRYLPAEEVSSIDELRRLASTLRYPPDLQVYAAASLRHYSDLLKKYYQDLSQNKYVEAPPLGFV